MKIVRLTESDIHHMILESVHSLLSESHHGELYHFTTLGLACGIVEDNAIYAREDSSEGNIDKRFSNRYNACKVVSLARNGTFGSGFEKEHGIVVRFTLDADKMSSSLRNAQIHPYNYDGFPWSERNWDFNPDDPNSLPMIKHPGTALSKEFEERLYFNDIYPLDKYCTRIDVLIRNWNCDDSSDHMYYIADQLGENASLELINKTMLKELQSNQTFANRIHIKVANIKYDYQFNIKNKNGGA